MYYSPFLLLHVLRGKKELAFHTLTVGRFARARVVTALNPHINYE